MSAPPAPVEPNDGRSCEAGGVELRTLLPDKMTLTPRWSEAKRDTRRPMSCALLPPCARVSCTLSVHGAPASATLKRASRIFSAAVGGLRGIYCMLLVSSCQGESSTSACLKCCQSFNSPGGGGGGGEGGGGGSRPYRGNALVSGGQGLAKHTIQPHRKLHSFLCLSVKPI